MLESLFNKETLLNFVKKRLQHACFPVKFAKIFKNTFFYSTTLVAASVICALQHQNFSHSTTPRFIMHPLYNKATFAQPQNQFHFRDHTCFSKNANFHVFVNLNQHIIAITNKKGNHMRITTTFNMNRSSHSQIFFKIAVKISQYSQENNCVRVSF